MVPEELPVHILIVDDRAENLAALEAILSGPEMILIRARSGAEALRQLLRQDFAVVLLDVQMPEMDGFETARYIRARPRSQHTPIIFLTALDSRDTNVFQGYSAGAVDFIFKPFNGDVLCSKVAVFVQLYRQRLALQQQAQLLEERVTERTHDLQAANASLQAEIAERRRAESALRFLTDATGTLASSLDFNHILQALAHLTVPFLADTCIVQILSGAAGPEQFAVATTHPELCAEILALTQASQGLYSSDRLARPLLQTNQPFYEARFDPTPLLDLAATPVQRAWLKSNHALIMVPLIVHEQLLGLMLLLASDPERSYADSDLLVAQELGQRAALALDHALLYGNLQAALQARDQFLSIASHELKTPITTVLGYAQLLSRRLQRAVKAEPRNIQALQTLVEQCQRLDRLIRSLLDLSRIQTGQFALELSTADVGALVNQVVTETRPSLKNHRLRFEPPAAPLTARIDELRLSQVFHNLVQNAIKYSPAGGTIEVSARAEAQGITISIRDEGIGIPAQALPLLFDRFYRASNAETSIGGMGVGLFVVREIVSQHGGTITVQSEEQAGSTFTITLPSAPTLLADQPAP